MKKPLILLVDDDRAVLEALEAELLPAFGEIARVEAFDDPRDVLAALPRWTADERPIAVAIVDQKMPGMTGVELLVALRRSATGPGAAAPSVGDGTAERDPMRGVRPASHLRAVMLTGYAGLESALGAVNEAGADRYLEKPWPSADLHRAVRRLLARHLSLTRADQFIEVREATDARLVRQLLRVRYDVYRDTPSLAQYVPANPLQLAVDEFDLVARFLALVTRSLSSESVVGGLRMVDATEGWSTPAIIHVAGELDALMSRLRAPRNGPLAMYGYWPSVEPLRCLVESLLSQRERVVEVGRLALRADARAAGAGGRRAAFLLLEGAVAFVGFVEEVANSFITCPRTHERAYRQLGFVRVPGTGAEFVPANREELVCLHGRPDRLEATVVPLARALADRFARTGAMCRCEVFPDCLASGYVSNRFDSVDLHCPSRSSEILLDETTAGSDGDVEFQVGS